jgi:calcineurin-like phosphoesterase family protein
VKPKIDIYIISDSHYNHWKINRYTNRKFKSLDEMNNTMLKRWNNIVRKKDIIIDLGDCVFTKGSSKKIKEFYNKLNGRHILVKGNHDRKSYSYYLADCVDFVCERFSWYFNGKKILFIHNPHKVKYGDLKRHDYIISGHTHNKGETFIRKRNCTFINVSCERLKYKPIKLVSALNQANKGYKNFKV